VGATSTRLAAWTVVPERTPLPAMISGTCDSAVLPCEPRGLPSSNSEKCQGSYARSLFAWPVRMMPIGQGVNRHASPTGLLPAGGGSHVQPTRGRYRVEVTTAQTANGSSVSGWSTSGSSAPRAGSSVRARFADQSAVRGQNLDAVVRLVRANGRCTRREISEVLGFNKATVSSLVKDLIATRLLEQEDAPLGQSPGRPSTLVRLDRLTYVCIVVEVLPENLVISTWNLAGERLSATSHSARPAVDGAARTLSSVARMLRAVVAEVESKGRLLGGVEVAVPGMVDTGSGQLIVSGPLSWSHVPVRDILAAELGCDEGLIDVEKFVNLATMAEWRRTDLSDLIYFDEGSAGLGVGAVVAGRMLAGHRGRAGELLFPQRDHLASKFSLHELGLDRLLDPLGDNGTTDVADQRPVVLDAAGRSAVKGLTRTLTRHLAGLAALLDPQVVILGGQFCALEPHIAQPLQWSLAQALAPISQDRIEVRFGAYGREAAQVGGALLVADRVVERLLALAGSRSG